MQMVEIGIPAYNSARFISDAINGCLMQDYQNIKVIIADDCSTDNTVSVIDDFKSEKRVVLSRNEQNIGRVNNYRHLLYNLAQSTWYINLDGDDYFIDPQFIMHAMNMIEIGGDDVVFYQGNHDMGKLKKVLPRFTILSGEDILVDGREYFIHFPAIQKNTHCATLFNRGKALPLNFYKVDCLFTDFHSLSRLALTGKVILSSKKVAVWRQHSSNASQSITETELRKEQASLDDIALFARNYLTEKEIAIWLRKMKDYFRMTFIYQKSTFAPGWPTIAFIIRHWRFNSLYMRYVIKNLLLMTLAFFKRKKARNQKN